MVLNRGLLFIALLCVLFQACLATKFLVVKTGSWDLSGKYQDWSDSNTFRVGDTLAFSYPASEHSVVETDSAGYQSCAPSNPLLNDSSGNTVVTLKTTDTHYFICGTSDHCSRGMKFSVSVLDSSTTGTATPTSTTDASAAATVAPPTALFIGAGIMSIAPPFLFFL